MLALSESLSKRALPFFIPHTMMRPRRRQPGQSAWNHRCGALRRTRGGKRAAPDEALNLAKNWIAAMKVNKWVLAAILFLLSAGMYAGIIFKMS